MFTLQGLKNSYLWIYKFIVIFSICNFIAMSCEEPTGNDDISKLAQPENLQISILSQYEVSLNWVDASENESGFYIERSISQSNSFVQIAIAGADIEQYIDSTIEIDTTYYYRVRAFNSLEVSDYSNAVSVTVTGDLLKPQSPSSLTVTSVYGNNITLAWIDNSDNENAFLIERRSQDEEFFSEIAILDADITVFADSDLNHGTTYYYRLRAVNDFGLSMYSNVATVQIDDIPPNAPGNLIVISSDCDSVKISWEDNSDNESGFSVERSVDSNNSFSVIAIADEDILEFTDRDVLCDMVYYYRVRAFNSSGSSEYSNEAEILVLPEPPAAPDSLTVTDATSSSISVSWVDNSDNEQGFSIEQRYSGGSDFIEIAVVDANNTSFTINELEPDKMYYYRLRAFNSGGYSNYSSETAGSTLEYIPHTPVDLYVMEVAGGQNMLTWTDVSNAEEGFIIERSADDNLNYISIADIESDIQEYIDSDIDPDVSYYFYRIKAYNSNGNSGYSNEVYVQKNCYNINEFSLYLSMPAELPYQENNIIEESSLPMGSGIYPIFNSQSPGNVICRDSLNAIDPDPTGLKITEDYDGDGIPNNNEIITNPSVSDLPRIVTRLDAPITLEIRNATSMPPGFYTTTVVEDDVKDTISNSMENINYQILREEALHYITEELYSSQYSKLIDYNSHTYLSDFSYLESTLIGGFFNAYDAYENDEFNPIIDFNNVPDFINGSKFTKKIVFENVDFRDNIDQHGIEYTDATVQEMIGNYKNSSMDDYLELAGPNAGYLRASLYIKNLTLNMPVHISNVICTLSFWTPEGMILPVKTFYLYNDDYTRFEGDVYGGEELGPFVIEFSNLNTYEIRQALLKGYVPQVHIVNYNMTKIADASYTHNIDDLKIIKETAIERTAEIKIIGPNLREIYRVPAFDINSFGDISPGISLKKALFNILLKRNSNSEVWEMDNNNNVLTVAAPERKWRQNDAEYIYSENNNGNEWQNFATYVKTYTDENNSSRRLETIKRIAHLTKYNPFDPADNPEFNASERLTQEQLNQMGYWVILHNGDFFNGDINDPIWAGERYEIIYCDLKDFNDHFKGYYYKPLLSIESLYLDTRWNALTDQDEYARAAFLGNVLKGDAVHLIVENQESRFLFWDSPDLSSILLEGGNNYKAWYNFNYSLEPDSSQGEGMPGSFGHSAAGGTNNIILNIENSSNALGYEITYCRVENNIITDICKTVSVTRGKILINRGNFTVASHTDDDDRDSNINFTGYIAGGEYYVQVYAFGEVYGVPVRMSSIDNDNMLNTRISVSNAENPPGSFLFQPIGSLNEIIINISESSEAEYFIINISGPENLGINDFPDGIIGYKGANIIKVDNPASADNNPVPEPGLYNITVTAVNQICTDINECSGSNLIQRTTPSNSGEQAAVVNYEPFADQKIQDSVPAIIHEQTEPEIIDLEVNFNDGSGWFLLKISDKNTGYPDNRVIDCRDASYIDDQNRVHIVFNPPDGSNGLPDVFIGGSVSAGLYLRTAAVPEYRDTFWLKPHPEDTVYGEELSSIYTYSEVDDFIDFWINANGTDATEIQSTHGLFNAWNISGPFPAEPGSYGMIDNGINDYFFAPLIERKYLITATVE